MKCAQRYRSTEYWTHQIQGLYNLLAYLPYFILWLCRALINTCKTLWDNKKIMIRHTQSCVFRSWRIMRGKRFLILFPQIINYLCCLFSKGWNTFTRFYPLLIRRNSSKYNTVEGVSILTSTKHVAIRSMCCSKGSILLLRLLPNELCHVRSRLERKYAVVKAFSIFNAFLSNIYRAVNIWYINIIRLDTFIIQNRSFIFFAPKYYVKWVYYALYVLTCQYKVIVLRTFDLCTIFSENMISFAITLTFHQYIRELKHTMYKSVMLVHA